MGSTIDIGREGMEETSEVVIEVVNSMLDNIDLSLGNDSESEADGVDLSAEAGPSNVDKDEPDEWTCAICLEPVPIASLAVVKGCGHTYCVHCIVHWASTRTSDPRCPTCKSKFSKVLCHTNLDGSFSGAPVEECVVLLARSRWFQNWLNEREHLKRLAQHDPSLAQAASQNPHRSDQAILQEELAEEALYGYFESQYEEDEVEEMYLAGSRGPRQAFGNRPWGPNGFVASGRRLAAPKLPKTVKQAGGKSQVAQNNNGSNQSGKKAGRRAQRKAKRAAADTSDV